MYVLKNFALAGFSSRSAATIVSSSPKPSAAWWYSAAVIRLRTFMASCMRDGAKSIASRLSGYLE